MGGERTEIQSELLFFRMENSDYISLGALIVSCIAAYYTWDANDRAKKKEKLESKILLNVTCEYDFYNRNVVRLGELNQIGQGLRFSLAIHNYGFRHAFIKHIYLMSSNQLAVNSIHEFSLTTTTERNVKSPEMLKLELWIPVKKLESLIGVGVEKTVFIRIITDGDVFFDSNTTKIKI